MAETKAGARREDVLLTVQDEGPCDVAWVAYCLNYNRATVMRDLEWLCVNGFVVADKVPGGGRDWTITAKGRDHIATEALR